MASISAFVRQHRLPVFFVLAFAIAWSSWPLAAVGVMDRLEFQSWGPLAAAIVVLAVADGLPGLRVWGSRFLRWRVGWIWWAVALVLPVAIHLSAAWFNDVLGGPSVDLARISWTGALGAFAFRLVMPLDGPLGEEPGWRGFAVPELQRRWSPLQSAALLGVAVAAWHAPLVFTGQVDGWIEIATTFVATVVYVWLFNRTGGSILLVLVFHAAEGLVQESGFGATGTDLDRASWLIFAVWTVVAAAVVGLDRAAWRPRIPAVPADRVRSAA